MTSLFGLFLFGLIVYFLFKNVRSIFRALFGQSQQPYSQNVNHQQQNSGAFQKEKASQNKAESKNRIILDDEGEYVDFEEVKDDTNKR